MPGSATISIPEPLLFLPQIDRPLPAQILPDHFLHRFCPATFLHKFCWPLHFQTILFQRPLPPATASGHSCRLISPQRPISPFTATAPSFFLSPALSPFRSFPCTSSHLHQSLYLPSL
ncbi:hypothetical protein MRB53_034568 [Persea americana]|uniref:Uncharacterized protein n=1 Tax=Persea americana TaxID=3435 RepID=A0ACC2K252_PERAE|nr:hypothetical protein MRB53_034568 [Persea americana]